MLEIDERINYTESERLFTNDLMKSADLMQIKTIIDKKYKELEIHVLKDSLDDEVRNVVRELHGVFDESLTGTDERGNKCVLRPLDIVSFYAEGQRVTLRLPVSALVYEDHVIPFAHQKAGNA